MTCVVPTIPLVVKDTVAVPPLFVTLVGLLKVPPPVLAHVTELIRRRHRVVEGVGELRLSRSPSRRRSWSSRPM